jgi:monofunctional biosynthetic peptidoglycan transglycosylase
MKKLLIGFLILASAYVLSIPPFWTLVFDNPSFTKLIARRSGYSIVPRILNPNSWISYKKLPKSLVDSIVVAEDGRFFEHSGIDVFEIKASIQSSFKKGDTPRGASTISQQLVKNLYLSEGFNPLRKIKEIIITFLVEKTLSKKRILEIYVNTIEWGENIYGISEASRFYFNQSPEKLSAHQAAFLAAIIPSPLSYYNPKANPKRVQRRMNTILARLKSLPK